MHRSQSTTDRTGQSIHIASDDTVISGITSKTSDFAGGIVDEVSFRRSNETSVRQIQRENMAMLQIGNIGFGTEGRGNAKGTKNVGGKFIRCKGCCVPTHRVNMFTRKKVPISNDRVENGRCLQCFPRNRRTSGFHPGTHNQPNNHSDHSNSLDKDQLLHQSVEKEQGEDCHIKTPHQNLAPFIRNESKRNRVVSETVITEKGRNGVTKIITTREIVEENDEVRVETRDKEATSKMLSIDSKFKDVSFHESVDNSTIGSEVSSFNDLDNEDEAAIDRNRSINILDTLEDLPDIHDLMLANQMEPALLEAACARIQKLAAEDNFLSGAAKIGLVNEVVESMDRHPCSENLQLKGCIALHYFAESGDENKAAVIDADAVPTIISCMRKYEQNGTLQNWAIQTLASLSGGNRDNKIQISVHNGIKAIVDAMNLHRDWEEVQVNAIKAIWSLTVNAFDNCFQVMEAGGVDSILNAISRLQGPIIDDFAVGALWSLVCSNDMKIYRGLADAGITKALIKIIHGHREFMKVQEKACTIVAQIVVNLPAETYVFVDNGGITGLIDAMCYYRDSLAIQESGCNILRVLAKLSSMNRKAIVQLGGIDAIYAAIEAFEELSCVHESTATLLLTALG